MGILDDGTQDRGNGNSTEDAQHIVLELLKVVETLHLFIRGLGQGA